jgi:hypothetical protein
MAAAWLATRHAAVRAPHPPMCAPEHSPAPPKWRRGRCQGPLLIAPSPFKFCSAHTIPCRVTQTFGTPRATLCTVGRRGYPRRPGDVPVALSKHEYNLRPSAGSCGARVVAAGAAPTHSPGQSSGRGAVAGSIGTPRQVLCAFYAVWPRGEAATRCACAGAAPTPRLRLRAVRRRPLRRGLSAVPDH